MSIQNSSGKFLLFMVVFFQSCQSKKTGYVDTFKLVSDFELQKEYSSLARKELDQARTSIDSVIAIEKLKDTVRANVLKDELYTSLSRNVEDHTKELEKIIWNRLNPYISQYGKEKGYQYIYGANGTGNILYADKSEDITDQLIIYVNNRYHDKK